ncbi:unnamed protein product [Ectocarpus sp. CCAP 1310/34]|nr:unnamed protein product [Ectocarpus sp. CCAP 1310/34]
MAEIVKAEIKGWRRVQVDKLTHGFWRCYVRREILRVAGVGVTPECFAHTNPVAAAAAAYYVDRWSLPMGSPDWTTFRRVGHFRHEEGHHHDDHRYQPPRSQQHHHHQKHQPSRRLLLPLPGGPADRFSVCFRSSLDGRVYRHIVLAVRSGGKWGSLGLSRRDTLLYKELKESYASSWHRLE